MGAVQWRAHPKTERPGVIQSGPGVGVGLATDNIKGYAIPYTILYLIYPFTRRDENAADITHALAVVYRVRR